MLLGFKRQFAPYVLDGTKTHTIRGIRKNAPKIGETCHCYVDPRQKSMKLLGRWPCVKVQSIRIDRARVWIDDVELDRSEKDLLAWRDGFRFDGTVMELCDPPLAKETGCFINLMLAFWAKTHGGEAFEGQMIHWDYRKAIK